MCVGAGVVFRQTSQGQEAAASAGWRDRERVSSIILQVACKHLSLHPFSQSINQSYLSVFYPDN